MTQFVWRATMAFIRICGSDCACELPARDLGNYSHRRRNVCLFNAFGRARDGRLAWLGCCCCCCLQTVSHTDEPNQTNANQPKTKSKSEPVLVGCSFSSHKLVPTFTPRQRLVRQCKHTHTHTPNEANDLGWWLRPTATRTRLSKGLATKTRPRAHINYFDLAKLGRLIVVLAGGAIKPGAADRLAKGGQNATTKHQPTSTTIVGLDLAAAACCCCCCWVSSFICGASAHSEQRISTVVGV